MKASLDNLRKITPWLLLILTIAYIITGFGITYFKVVEKITFGILTKALSFKVHENLIFPFLIVLVVHIFLVIKKIKK